MKNISKENVEKKQLSDEEKELLKNEINKYFMKLIKDDFIKEISDDRKKFKKVIIQDTKDILNSYCPLKKELTNLEETYLSNDEIKIQKEKFLEKLMQNPFEETNLPIEKKLKEYTEIQRKIIFMDKSVESYIELLDKENKELEQDLNKTKEQKIQKNIRKKTILKKHYIEGISNRQIKDDLFYANDVKYSKDCNELLWEIAPYFNGMYKKIIGY